MKACCLLLWFLWIGAARASAQDKNHIFPQFADGKFSDGTYYQSTVMILPWFDTEAATCTLALNGLNTSFDVGGAGNRFTISVPAGGSYIAKTAGLQPIVSGYASLTCSDEVLANVLYSFHAANGVELSAATVFSSSVLFTSFQAKLQLDHRAGARVGVAIANDSDVPHTYTIAFTGNGSTTTNQITVPARRNVAKFADELLLLPTNAVGILSVKSTDFSDVTIIGLRYVGAAFTTIPAVGY